MKSTKYLIRSVKYFVKISALVALIFVAMHLTGTLNVPSEAFISEFFGSTKGQLFLALVLVWSAIYPKVEYVTEEYNVDLDARRRDVIEAMRSLGMNLAVEGEGMMVFRSASGLSRLWQMFEDSVEIRKTSRGVEISGSRKNVANAKFKIRIYSERENE